MEPPMPKKEPLFLRLWKAITSFFKKIKIIKNK